MNGMGCVAAKNQGKLSNQHLIISSVAWQTDKRGSSGIRRAKHLNSSDYDGQSCWKFSVLYHFKDGKKRQSSDVFWRNGEVIYVDLFPGSADDSAQREAHKS